MGGAEGLKSAARPAIHPGRPLLPSPGTAPPHFSLLWGEVKGGGAADERGLLLMPAPAALSRPYLRRDPPEAHSCPPDSACVACSAGGTGPRTGGEVFPHSGGTRGESWSNLLARVPRATNGRRRLHMDLLHSLDTLRCFCERGGRPFCWHLLKFHAPFPCLKRRGFLRQLLTLPPPPSPLLPRWLTRHVNATRRLSPGAALLAAFMLIPYQVVFVVALRTFSVRELVPACVVAVASLLAYALIARLRSRWSVHLLSNVSAAFLVASVSSLVLAGFTMNDVEPPDVPVEIRSVNGTPIIYVAGPATYSDDDSSERQLGSQGGKAGARGGGADEDFRVGRV